MSTEFARIDTINKTIDTVVVDTVVEKEETHTEFLTRRSHAMAGMIGAAGSNLSLIPILCNSAITYGTTVKSLKLSLVDISKQSLKSAIALETAWMEMGKHNDPEYYGAEFCLRRIAEYTKELEALETLVV